MSKKSFFCFSRYDVSHDASAATRRSRSTQQDPLLNPTTPGDHPDDVGHVVQPVPFQSRAFVLQKRFQSEKISMWLFCTWPTLAHAQNRPQTAHVHVLPASHVQKKHLAVLFAKIHLCVLFLCVLFCRNVTCFRKDLNDVFLCVFFFCFSSNLQISRFPRSSTRSWKIRHRFRGIWKRDPSRDRQRCSSRLQNHADECYEDYVC